MDFVNYIMMNGCSIKCIYANTNNDIENSNGSIHLITENERYFTPELDQNSTLLLSILITKFMKDVSDPFNYNPETGYGEMLINGKKVDIILPQYIHQQNLHSI